MKYRPLLAAVVVLAVPVSALVLVKRERVAAAPSSTPVVYATPSSSDEAGAIPPPPGRAVAHRLSYDLTLRQEVRLGGDLMVDDVLRARLSWLPIPDAPLVEARLVDAQFSGTGHELPRRDDLEREVLLQLDEVGSLAGLRFHPRTPEPARLLLTALFSAMQFTPGAADGRSITEQDGTGRYTASYTRRGPRAFAREKRGYAALHETGGPVRAEGTTEFEVSASNELVAVRSTETTSTRSAAFGAIEGSLQVEARFLGREEATEHDLDLARERAATFDPARFVSPESAEDDARLARDLDEQRVNGATLADLRRSFAETEGLPRGGANGERRADLIETAGALFRIRPDEARAAGQRLGASGVTDAEANFLAGGLASAGTREAAHALADALGSRDASVEAKRQAVASLNLIGQADSTTVSALREAARSDDPALQNMSKLALGSQARELTAGENDGLDPVADLLYEYEQARDLPTRAMYIAAFGNSGDLRTLPAIRAALGLAELAPTAAFALRFMPTPEADDLLRAAAMAGNPSVRVATYRAVTFRDAALWAPWLRSALEREEHPQAKDALRAASDHAEG